MCMCVCVCVCVCVNKNKKINRYTPLWLYFSRYQQVFSVGIWTEIYFFLAVNIGEYTGKVFKDL